jgi:hypothetical protein
MEARRIAVNLRSYRLVVEFYGRAALRAGRSVHAWIYARSVRGTMRFVTNRTRQEALLVRFREDSR